MPEMQSSAKADIRSQLNLIFATMKLLSATLDIDNASAKEAVAATADCVNTLSAVLSQCVKEYLGEGVCASAANI